MASPAQASARLTHLWRWPIKGLGGESLDQVAVSAGQLFPHDRAFALENGPSDFKPEAPEHVAKRQFVCMVHQPTTGRMTARYEEAADRLHITTLDGRSMIIDPDDPAALEALAEDLVDGPVRGPLKLRRPREHGTGHGFTDVPDRWISIQNEASIASLERAAGARLDPRRLRANVLLSGWDAFAEEDLVGKTVRLGTAEVRIEEPINRCRAIDVNPDTAGQDQDLVRTLQGMRGKRSLGVYARITKKGTMAQGDPVSVL